ncbi:MAG: MFS transporter [Alphaproteobacteria bacterium]|nr:MFS transporter [Alphaproteobacteria bacterium]
MAPYVLLYGALYAGWGVLSPFLPAVLAGQGAGAEQIGLLLGLALAMRLLAMPAAGVLADRLRAPRQVLSALLAAAAGLALGFQMAEGFAGLLLVCLAHAVACGPLGPLPDALAVEAARRRQPGGRIDYGVVRGAGAAAFIAGTALTGPAIGSVGSLAGVLWANALCFALAAGIALRVPVAPVAMSVGQVARSPVRMVLRQSGFRRLLLVAGLIQGSHAFYGAFATLRWQAAGLSPGTIGLFWSVAVSAEVFVFLVLGRRLLRWLGPGRLCAVAAGAGVLRWSVMAETTWLPAMLLMQPLHGLTFAAQHLAAMALIARAVPARQSATAQALYATFGVGFAGAALTVLSGPLYAWLGAGGFWAMALLCAAAVPTALGLRAAEPAAA